MSALIRGAAEADLPALLALNNAAIADTTANWDLEQWDLDDQIAWFKARQAAGMPVLVADIDGAVAGYATYGPWRPKPGYRHTVENTVYLDPTYHRQGIATQLMTALLDHARAAGAHVMVAGIESRNIVSIALHKKLGFEVVAHMPEVGRKFDRWLDLTYLQRFV